MPEEEMVSAHRGTARLFGVMARVLGAGAAVWLAVVVWGAAAGWNAAKLGAAAQGGWWTGAVAVAALGAQVLCLYLARREEAR